MSMLFSSSFRLVSVLIFALFITGCAHQIAVSPNQANVLTTAPKVQVDVGLIISSSSAAFNHSERKFGDEWVYANLGESTMGLFRNAIIQRFRRVKELSGRNQAPSENISVIVEPLIESFIFDIPILKFQTYPATLKLRVTVVDPTGKVIYTNVISGVGDSKGSPGFDFSANPARSATKAVEEAVKNAVEDLANSPAIKSLIQ